MNHENEKYYVASDGEQPHQLYFGWEDAEKSNAQYLDAFDQNGKPVKSYKLVDGQYTTQF